MTITKTNNGNTFIEIHILQTLPPSCVNRDDTGSPKTAFFGGVQRARVSSQAWKKATRDMFAQSIDPSLIGYRTVEIVQLVSDAMMKLDDSIPAEDIVSLAEKVVSATGIKIKNRVTGYLLFVSPKQVNALAEIAVRAYAADEDIPSKEAKAALNIRQNSSLNAIDIAMFGRMVADAPDLNADASVQVAHAIGVDRGVPEFDYFTAVDDLKPDEDSGATMIGTVEYMSTTLYRYATIDVKHLIENLGSEDAAKLAVENFVKAFVLSMPTGKQNTFANRTLPNAVAIQVRKTQPINLSSAFEQPVAAGPKDIPSTAADRLAAYATSVEQAFGESASHTFVISSVDSDALMGLATEAEHSLPEAIASLGCLVFPSDAAADQQEGE